VSTLEERLRKAYTLPKKADPVTKAWATGDGFVTEVSGRILFTAPAHTFHAASEIPVELAEEWGKQSQANPYFMWVQGRFVEAEQANQNGAFWSTGDLEFGEMGVRHGPLNWLHQDTKVIGTIADGKLIHPMAAPEAASVERPFIAATAAIWKWLYPDEARDVEKASDSGKLFYSMECIAEQIECAGVGGCGQSFDYLKAVTDPSSVCSHVRERSTSRRMVNPSFLGGAVIVPPLSPGWRGASASVVRQAASMAESTHSANHSGLSPAEWEGLMAAVLAR
jgi:hypothetical protein